MKHVFAALMLIVATSSANMAESPVAKANIWDVTFAPKGNNSSKTTSAVGKLIFIQTSDNEFRVLDPASDNLSVGKMGSEGLIFQFPMKQGAQMAVPAAFKGFPSKSPEPLGHMVDFVSGQGSLGGQPVEWKANRLVSLWACSNHDPRHTASGEEDMKKHTRDDHCQGWHRLAQPQTDVLFLGGGGPK